MRRVDDLLLRNGGRFMSASFPRTTEPSSYSSSEVLSFSGEASVVAPLPERNRRDHTQSSLRIKIAQDYLSR